MKTTTMTQGCGRGELSDMEAPNNITVSDRLFRFLESGMTQTVLGRVGGLAGTFLDGRYFAVLTPLIPAAIHRAKVLEGIERPWSTIWISVSFPATFLVLFWIGLSVNASRTATFTPSDYAQAVSKILNPSTTVSTTEIIEPPANTKTTPLPGKTAARSTVDSSLTSIYVGNLAERANSLSDQIMNDLDTRGWRHYKDDPVPSKSGRYMPLGNGQERENWNATVYDYFEFVYLPNVVSIRNEFAQLNLTDYMLDGALRGDPQNVTFIITGQAVVTSFHKTGDTPGMLPVEIEVIAQRLKVLANKLPKQP